MFYLTAWRGEKASAECLRFTLERARSAAQVLLCQPEVDQVDITTALGQVIEVIQR